MVNLKSTNFVPYHNRAFLIIVVKLDFVAAVKANSIHNSKIKFALPKKTFNLFKEKFKSQYLQLVYEVFYLFLLLFFLFDKN